MHPILASPRRLGLYLLISTPFAALLIFLLHVSGHLTFQESILLSLPFCVVDAFLCMTAWYICRVTPVRTAGAARLASTYGMSALVASGLMLLVAQGIARVIPISPERLHPDLPLLFGTGVLGYL